MAGAVRWTVFLAACVCSGLALRIPFLRRYEPLSYDLDHLTAQHRSLRERSADQESSINLQFIAMHRSFDLVLTPDTSVFHRDLTVRSSHGPLSTHHLTTSTFTGYDKNTPGSRLHGNLISGVFDGTIYTNNEIYYIEPAHRYARETLHHSIVYRHSDINKEALQGGRCGLSDDSTLVGYLERLGRSMVTPEEVPGVTRERRQDQRNLERVRCDLNVTGDYLFFREVTRNIESSSLEERVSVAQSLLVSYVQGASEIYKKTDFDGDRATTDNIQFGIRDLVIETTPSPSPFNREFIGVEKFLRDHSETSNFERTLCLHYRFTHRDFDGGVLGLAYVAKEGSRGGICETSLNTGIVTILNYGKRVLPVVTVVTFAHEAGHNFGSEHDPEGTDCAPGGSRGNFVMYAFANDGGSENNKVFSTCSRASMQKFISSRGQLESRNCFSAATDLCQNGLLDNGEQCDCGIRYDQTTGRCDNDPCCNGTSCRLFGSSSCSPDQGDCCNAVSCEFLNSSHVCAEETDCGQPSNCNCCYGSLTPPTGSSASCPSQQPKDPETGLNYLLCNNGTATCSDSECTGSFCVVLNATGCQCKLGEEECHLCCQLEEGGNCLSTISIAKGNSSQAGLLPGRMGLLLPVGAPCDDFRGYCDFLNNCFQVDSEGALDRLTNLFSAGNVNKVLTFAREKWWALLAAGLGLLIGIFVLILIIHLVLPRPEHVKARSQRRQTIRRNRNVGGGVYPGENRRGHEMKLR